MTLFHVIHFSQSVDISSLNVSTTQLSQLFILHMLFDYVLKIKVRWRKVRLKDIPPWKEKRTENTRKFGIHVVHGASEYFSPCELQGIYQNYSLSLLRCVITATWFIMDATLFKDIYHWNFM